jgi:hypothetical protein
MGNQCHSNFGFPPFTLLFIESNILGNDQISFLELSILVCTYKLGIFKDILVCMYSSEFSKKNISTIEERFVKNNWANYLFT